MQVWHVNCGLIYILAIMWFRQDHDMLPNKHLILEDGHDLDG